MAMISSGLGLVLTGLSLLGSQERSKPVSTKTDSDKPVVIVTIKGPIEVSSVALFQRALRTARSEKAQALIVELDTPGGAVDRMWEIARPLREEENIRTVAFVNPMAISAGAFIASACQEIYMTSSSSIGDAMPIRVGMDGTPRAVSDDPEVRKKEYSFFRAEIRKLVERRGENAAQVSEAMIDPELELRRIKVNDEIKILKGAEIDDLYQKKEKFEDLGTIQARGTGPLTLTSQQALTYEFAKGIAENREQLLNFLSLSKASVQEVKATWSEDFVSFLSGIAPVLLVLGFVLAFVEMKIPGFGVAGILSIACFALLFFGNYLTGLAEIFHIILFVLGIALILVEIFVTPGTIIVGVVGALCLLYGLLSSFMGFLWPSYPLDYETLNRTGEMFVIALFIILLSILILAWAISRYLPNLPFLGKQLVLPVEPGSHRGSAAGMTTSYWEKFLGQTGIALTDLRPAGKVQFQDEIVDAQSDGGFIEKGATVSVVEVSTNRLMVAKA